MVRIYQAGGVIRQWHVEREALGTWENLSVPAVVKDHRASNRTLKGHWYLKGGSADGRMAEQVKKATSWELT